MIHVDDLTPEEKRAINALIRIGKKWPKSLWIYAGEGGSVSVLRKGADGEHAVTPVGGVDQSYVVATVFGIENDGGDW